MRNWLIFRPEDRDFDLNVQILYQDRDRYDFVVVFRHRADERVKYVRMLGDYLAFADYTQIGETRIHVQEIDRVLIRAKR